MQTPSFRWDDLRVVLELGRAGSLKGAAAWLDVNISTVSRRLGALEEQLGMHLFDRTPDGTLPTAAAEELLPFAEDMERAAVRFSHALEGLEFEPEGVVRITAPPGVVDHFLAATLAPLTARYPKLRLELLSTIGYADLTRREADIALRVVRPATGDLVAKRLASFPSVPVAAPGYAARVAPLKDLNDAQWVTWGDDLAAFSETRWVLEQVEASRVVLRSSSMTAQIQAVRAGIGVMLAPPPYAGLDGLCLVPLELRLKKTLRPAPEGSLWLVGHRALRDVPRIRAVWSYLEDAFASTLV
jgi:DNA-binding transcriptional LysR family regulator